MQKQGPKIIFLTVMIMMSAKMIHNLLKKAHWKKGIHSVCKTLKGALKLQIIEEAQGFVGLLSPKSYVDVPAEPKTLTFSIPIFLPNYPLITIQFSIEFCPNWVLFY